MRNTDVIQAIKSRMNLADMARRYVELRSVGSRLVAPCPFHQETKPSFSINEEQGTFYCFGCQASGDLFDFYGRLNGLLSAPALLATALAPWGGAALAQALGSYPPVFLVLAGTAALAAVLATGSTLEPRPRLP
jgi:DNA primase